MVDNPEDMMSDVDREILVTLLLSGANSPKNLAEICGRHQQSIQRRLPELVGDYLVRKKGTGIYELTEVGLESARIVWKESNVIENLDLDHDSC